MTSIHVNTRVITPPRMVMFVHIVPEWQRSSNNISKLNLESLQCSDLNYIEYARDVIGRRLSPRKQPINIFKDLQQAVLVNGTLFR